VYITDKCWHNYITQEKGSHYSIYSLKLNKHTHIYRPTWFFVQLTLYARSLQLKASPK